ncbi:uncharacterized protein LOC127542519 [Antechinus flavipes]|uniref:uncharacterized protein LOC127542519 n=1 Tax=Antechinus flavipes TaxID=38775 RepID=UPI0022359406|nr:uncharacterized protein LOC127542519 [Antechinus flavipes]
MARQSGDDPGSTWYLISGTHTPSPWLSVPSVTGESASSRLGDPHRARGPRVNHPDHGHQPHNVALARDRHSLEGVSAASPAAGPPLRCPHRAPLHPSFPLLLPFTRQLFHEFAAGGVRLSCILIASAPSTVGAFTPCVAIAH